MKQCYWQALPTIDWTVVQYQATSGVGDCVQPKSGNAVPRSRSRRVSEALPSNKYKTPSKPNGFETPLT
jgi:hypothetical protein